MLLGVRVLNEPTTLESYDADCSEQIVESTQRMLQSICGGDDDLYDRTRRKIMVLCGDGCPGLQRSLRLHVHSLLPQVALVTLVVRDSCHAVRIATKEPLSRLSRVFGLSLSSQDRNLHSAVVLAIIG